MMDFEDFEEIMLLLEKSCDQCLLTQKHCVNCRIEKLRKVIGQFDAASNEIMLIRIDELRILLNLASEGSSAREYEVLSKWRRAVGESSDKEITA